MANVKQLIVFNPDLVALALTADVYEIEMDPASRYAPRHDARGRGVVRVRVVTGNIRFAIGKDPTSATQVFAAADGWTEFAFHNGVNNLFAKGSANGATFVLAAS